MKEVDESRHEEQHKGQAGRGLLESVARGK